jgi:hypothetical protein
MPMADDPGSLRAAKLPIDRHGEKAALRATGPADQLLEASDMIGATTWRRMLKAIEGLKRDKPKREMAI